LQSIDDSDESVNVLCLSQAIPQQIFPKVNCLNYIVFQAFRFKNTNVPCKSFIPPPKKLIIATENVKILQKQLAACFFFNHLTKGTLLEEFEKNIFLRGIIWLYLDQLNTDLGILYITCTSKIGTALNTI